MKVIKKIVLCLVLLAPFAVFAEEKEGSFVGVAWHNAMTKFRNATKNETINVIKNRRSIRAYKPGQVNEKDLLAVIEAGLYAPSAKNSQSWHFTVVQNSGLLDTMTEMYKQEIIQRGGEAAKIAEEDTTFRIFHGAPCAIIVSGDEKDEMAAINCAAAVQNMLIAAEALGLGTCWMQSNMILFEGVKGKELMKTMQVPEGYKPLYTFALGYKAENPEPKPRKEGGVTYIK